jgi:hypothetical protein
MVSYYRTRHEDTTISDVTVLYKNKEQRYQRNKAYTDKETALELGFNAISKFP